MYDKPVISLSTSYLQRRFKDGYEMLCKAAEYGFEYVELGHSTPVTAMDGIKKALSEGIVKVSSLHNFCPVPGFARGPSPNLFSPSTRWKSESAQWVRHSKNTVAFAKDCNARAIVFHMGSLNYFFYDKAAALRTKADEIGFDKLKEDKSFQAARSRFLRSSKRKANRAYKHIADNIGAIADDFKDTDILMGIENREGVGELPMESSFVQMLELAKPYGFVRAWHDIGHSKIKELMGFCTQEDLIEKTLPLIAGWHLHDCDESGKDHQGIGKGCIDFKSLKRFFDAKRHLFILEINSSVPEGDVIDSRKFTEDMLS